METDTPSEIPEDGDEFMDDEPANDNQQATTSEGQFVNPDMSMSVPEPCPGTPDLVIPAEPVNEPAESPAKKISGRKKHPRARKTVDMKPKIATQKEAVSEEVNGPGWVRLFRGFIELSRDEAVPPISEQSIVAIASSAAEWSEKLSSNRKKEKEKSELRKKEKKAEKKEKKEKEEKRKERIPSETPSSSKTDRSSRMTSPVVRPRTPDAGSGSDDELISDAVLDKMMAKADEKPSQKRSHSSMEKREKRDKERKRAQRDERGGGAAKKARREDKAEKRSRHKSSSGWQPVYDEEAKVLSDEQLLRKYDCVDRFVIHLLTPLEIDKHTEDTPMLSLLPVGSGRPKKRSPSPVESEDTQSEKAEYDSDAADGDLSEQNKKAVRRRRKSLSDRECHTCGRCLGDCTVDWYDDLGKDSSYCSTKCIDVTVERTFKVLGSMSATTSLMRASGQVMPDGPCLARLGEFLRECPDFTPILPSSSSTTVKSNGATAAPSQPKTPKVLSKDSDQIRFGVRKAMADALLMRVKRTVTTSGTPFRMKECKDTAEKLEHELFKACELNASLPRYKMWFKQFIVQVKDMKNKGFYHRILSGDLSAQKATSLEPTELASNDYSTPIGGGTTVEETNGETGKKDDSATSTEDRATAVANEIQKAAERKAAQLAAVANQSSTLDALLGDGKSDTTAQHLSHLYDANCSICAVKQKTVAEQEKRDREDKERIREEDRKRREKRKLLVPEVEEKLSSEQLPVEGEVEFDANDPLGLTKRQMRPASPHTSYAAYDSGEDDYGGGASSLPPSPFHGGPFPTGESRDRDERVKEETWKNETPMHEDGWRSSRLGRPESWRDAPPPKQYDPWDRDTTVWRGHISMGPSAFVTSLIALSNPIAFEMSRQADLPVHLKIKGRIQPIIVFDYLSTLRQADAKDVIVMEVIEPGAGARHFWQLYEDMLSKDRYLVFDFPADAPIKDAYLLPLPANKEPPAVLLPFDGPGVDLHHPNMIICIMVRHREQAWQHNSRRSPSASREGARSVPIPPEGRPSSTSIPSSENVAPDVPPVVKGPEKIPWNGCVAAKPAPTTFPPGMSLAGFSDSLAKVSGLIAARRETNEAPPPQVAQSENEAAGSKKSTTGDSLLPSSFFDLLKKDPPSSSSQPREIPLEPVVPDPEKIDNLPDLLVFIQMTENPKLLKSVVARFFENPYLTEHDRVVIKKKVFEKIQVMKQKKNKDKIAASQSVSMEVANSPEKAKGAEGDKSGRDSAGSAGEPGIDRPFSPSDFDACDRPTSFLDVAGDLLSKFKMAATEDVVKPPAEPASVEVSSAPEPVPPPPPVPAPPPVENVQMPVSMPAPPTPPPPPPVDQKKKKEATPPRRTGISFDSIHDHDVMDDVPLPPDSPKKTEKTREKANEESVEKKSDERVEKEGTIEEGAEKEKEKEGEEEKGEEGAEKQTETGEIQTIQPLSSGIPVLSASSAYAEEEMEGDASPPDEDQPPDEPTPEVAVPSTTEPAATTTAADGISIPPPPIPPPPPPGAGNTSNVPASSGPVFMPPPPPPPPPSSGMMSMMSVPPPGFAPPQPPNPFMQGPPPPPSMMSVPPPGMPPPSQPPPNTFFPPPPPPPPPQYGTSMMSMPPPNMMQFAPPPPNMGTVPHSMATVTPVAYSAPPPPAPPPAAQQAPPPQAAAEPAVIEGAPVSYIKSEEPSDSPCHTPRSSTASEGVSSSAQQAGSATVAAVPPSSVYGSQAPPPVQLYQTPIMTAQPAPAMQVTPSSFGVAPPPFGAPPPQAPPPQQAPPPPQQPSQPAHGSAGFGGPAPSMGGKYERASLIDYWNKNVGGVSVEVPEIPLELMQDKSSGSAGTMPGLGRYRTDEKYVDDNIPRTPTPSPPNSPGRRRVMPGVRPGQRAPGFKKLLPGARIPQRPPSPTPEELEQIAREERIRIREIERRLRDEKRAKEREEWEKRREEREKERKQRRDEREKEREEREKERERRRTEIPKNSVNRLGLGKIPKNAPLVVKNIRIRLVAEAENISMEEAEKKVNEEHMLGTDESADDSEVEITVDRRPRRSRGSRDKRRLKDIRVRDQTVLDRLVLEKEGRHATGRLPLPRQKRALNVEYDEYDYEQFGLGRDNYEQDEWGNRDYERRRSRSRGFSAERGPGASMSPTGSRSGRQESMGRPPAGTTYDYREGGDSMDVCSGGEERTDGQRKDRDADNELYGEMDYNEREQRGRGTTGSQSQTAEEPAVARDADDRQQKDRENLERPHAPPPASSYSRNDDNPWTTGDYRRHPEVGSTWQPRDDLLMSSQSEEPGYGRDGADFASDKPTEGYQDFGTPASTEERRNERENYGRSGENYGRSAENYGRSAENYGTPTDQWKDYGRSREDYGGARDDYGIQDNYGRRDEGYGRGQEGYGRQDDYSRSNYPPSADYGGYDQRDSYSSNYEWSSPVAHRGRGGQSQRGRGRGRGRGGLLGNPSDSYPPPPSFFNRGPPPAAARGARGAAASRGRYSDASRAPPPREPPRSLLDFPYPTDKPSPAVNQGNRGLFGREPPRPPPLAAHVAASPAAPPQPPSGPPGTNLLLQPPPPPPPPPIR